jgi:hypothetical protein
MNLSNHDICPSSRARGDYPVAFLPQKIAPAAPAVAASGEQMFINTIAPNGRNDPEFGKIGTDRIVATPLLRHRCDDALWTRAVSVNPLNARMKGLPTRGMY